MTRRVPRIPDGEPGPRPVRRFRKTKAGAGLVTFLTAWGLSGEPAESPVAPNWQLSPDAPRVIPDPPEVTFEGDVTPELIAAYHAAAEATEQYWQDLPVGERMCDQETVIFTDQFDERPDRDPNSEPSGALDTETCQKWLNSERNADELKLTNTHEEGHNRGLGHSIEEESLMYCDPENPVCESDGKTPPAAATVERFEQMLDVEVERADSD